MLINKIAQNDYFRCGIVVFILFFILAAIFTFPLIFKMNYAVYGFLGDNVGSFWDSWWEGYAELNNLSKDKITVLAYPFGRDLTYAPRQTLAQFELKFLSKLFNGVLAWNLIIFFSFPLSGTAMFFLVYYLTKDKLASFISGIIFMLAPYHYMHAYGHLSLVTIQWMPLYVLSLIILLNDSSRICLEGGGQWAEKSRKIIIFLAKPFLAAFTFSIVLLENYYYGYFMAVFTVIFLIGYYLINFVKQRKLIFHRGKIIVLVMALIFSIIIVFPFIQPIVKTFFKINEKSFVAKQGYIRDFSHLRVYSARLHDYLVPPIDNPFWGRYVEKYVRDHLHGSNLSENTLFLGYFPLFFSLIALFILWIKWKKRKIPSVNLENDILEKNIELWVILFALTATIIIVFSGPPTISRGFFTLYLPSFFMYKIFPMFRVYARLGIVVMLCVSVLAGIGISFVFNKIKKIRNRILLIILFIVIVFIEFMNFPPTKVTEIKEFPKVYSWLEKQEGGFAIAEYPMVHSEEIRYYHYVSAQPIHKKKLINGAQLGTDAERFRQQIFDISKDKVPGLLKYLGAEYVLVHKNFYTEGMIPPEQKKYFDPAYTNIYNIEYNNGYVPNLQNNPGLKKIKSFGEIDVYKIIADVPDIILIYGENTGNVEKWNNGQLWRWMSNNGKIQITNNFNHKIKINILFNAISFNRERKLEVFINSQLTSTSKVRNEGNSYIIPDVLLSPGINNLRLYTPEGTDNIDVVLCNGDNRNVSIAFSNFEVIKTNEIIN